MSIDFALFGRIASSIRTAALQTPKLGLKMRTFHDDNGSRFVAIQQNPNKGSEWAKMARSGHDVVQFKSIPNNKYVAVAVDGKVKEY